ncbi:hypothetical protein SteCoe_29098 [Stentor coeruleus]|uniref:Rap-GAP domain-containing protein n=1 Tax=Stentor coeruleus TaxID=5963 RepID=A0A1R2B6R9_9CILI|nr:hypothetical protein SteCoe_29098 [Stentor coeruleus]
MSLWKWFSGKPSADNLAEMQEILYEEKSLAKRHSIMINSIQRQLKSTSEKFDLKLYDFFKKNSEIFTTICLSYIFQTDPKCKPKSWEEITDTFIALVEMTRYGQIRKVEDIQNIAKACLQDGNRYELKHYGLQLVLNLVSHKEMLHIPFDIFQAAIDFSVFTNDHSLQLTNRHVLSSTEEVKWIGPIKELLSRTPLKFPELKNIQSFIPHNELVREMITLFKDVLQYTLSGAIIQNTVNYSEHFRKWLGILRRSYLLVLYPDLIDNSYNGGFNKCPHLLHHLVIYWINRFTKKPEIVSFMFVAEQDRKLILGILEKSFVLFTQDSPLSIKNALKSYGIFESWIVNKRNLELKDITLEEFFLTIVKHTTCIFNYKKDTSKSRIEICAQSFNIFNLFHDKFPDNLDFIKTLLSLCDILKKQEPCNELIERLSVFILKVMKRGVIASQSSFAKTTKDFKPYLHQWANKHTLIIQEWKNKIFELSIETNYSLYTNINNINFWLDYIKLLGDPLDFCEDAQNEWVCSLHQIIFNLLEKIVSPVVLLQCFLTDLSRLILEGYESTQKTSLDTVCLLYTKSSYERPSAIQTQHLFYLLSVAIQRIHLKESILSHSPKLLDYYGIHPLLKDLISLSFIYMNEGLLLVYRICCLPNYYRKTPLLSLDGSTTTYLALKNDVYSFFVKRLTESPRTCVIDAFTVFIVEEIACQNNEMVKEGIDILMNICNNKESNISFSALQSVGVIAPIFPSHQHYILDFVIKNILDQEKFSNDYLIMAIFDLIVSLLMNLKTKVTENMLQQLFDKVADFSESIIENSKLKIFLDLFLSFLSFYYLNFPVQDNCIEIFDSNIKDKLSSAEEYYSLNNNTIITLHKNNFIIRNEFGKYLWTCSNFDIFDASDKTEAKDKLLKIFKKSKISLKVQENPHPLSQSETLELLISFIHNNYEPYLAGCPVNSYEDIPKKIEYIENLENNIIESHDKINLKNIKKSSSVSKILIANLGFLNELVPLESSEKLDRALGLLDCIRAREQVKIGVLYVKPGQDDEKDILANDSCSKGFQEFLTKLGRVVELENYGAYLGGLDQKGSCGKISISYTDWEHDVMFHVPVLIPTDINDNLQVIKKRHVGNDQVVIIWSENWKEYRQDTIVTHFNFVNIIIYPLEKLLYRIQIQVKSQVRNVEFGPLKDGMVVHWKVLPILVRLTAINANKMLKINKHPSFEKQPFIRSKSIREIIRDNGVEPVTISKKLARQSLTHYSHSSMESSRQSPF